MGFMLSILDTLLTCFGGENLMQEKYPQSIPLRYNAIQIIFCKPFIKMCTLSD